MIFTQKFDMYGQSFNVKMLSQKEVEGLGELKEEAMFELITSVILDDKMKPVFKTAEEAKNALPPKVIEQVINLSAGIEKKSE